MKPTESHHLRNAQGNVMHIFTFIEEYKETTEVTGDNLYLTERSFYGSSRLVTENVNEVIASSYTSNININMDKHQLVGDRNYELSNHLGNVLQVVTDRKLAVDDGTGDVDYYVADVVSQSDYYPFGMMMPNRNESGDEYRYGFNGMEKDDEVAGDGNSYDFGARMYNPRIVRFLSLDPLSRVNPHESNYSYAANNPILYVDEGGEDNVIYLVVLPSDDPEQETLDAHKVAKEANKMYETLGVETRVVVFDESERGTFEPSNMDNNDSYAVVGSSSEIEERLGFYPSEGSLENATTGGAEIATPYGTIDKYMDLLPVSSEEELVAFSIVHGSGHNTQESGDNHASLMDSDLDNNFVNFMSHGGVVVATLNDDVDMTSGDDNYAVYGEDIRAKNPDINTIQDLFSPDRNKKVVASFEEHFGTNKATDNYDKNKSAKSNSSGGSGNGNSSSGSVAKAGKSVGGIAKKVQNQ